MSVPGSHPVVEGRLDGLVDGHVLGWAWSPESPTERIWVALFVDDEPVGLTAADLERRDLLAVGVGDGAHGFAIEIPPPLRSGGGHVIRVMAGGSNTQLHPSAGFSSNGGSPLSGEISLAPVPGGDVSVSAADGARQAVALPRLTGGVGGAEWATLLDRPMTRAAQALERVPVWVRWAALVVVLLAVTWPFGSPVPRPGTDRSWQIGLALAFSRGLVFGRDIIFTYGPLGFTVHPLRTSAGAYRVALIVGALVQAGLLVALLVCVRRTMGLAVAVLAAFVLASLVGETQADPLLAIAFGAVALTLTASADRSEHAARMLAIWGGALAAAALLVKLDDGTASAVVITIGLAGTARPRRALAQGAISFAVALCVVWLLVGQPLGALPGYFEGAYQVVTGYVDAMGRDTAGSKGIWMLLLLLGSAVALSVGAWVSMAGRGERRRRSLVLVVLALHYCLFREMFTREGVGRGIQFALLAAVAIMIPWRGRGRLAGIAIAATLWVATFSFYPSTPSATLVPLARTQAMVTQLQRAFGHGPSEARAKLVERVDALPGPVLAAIRGHCVTVEPNEIAVVWAYRLHWCPLPALQSYNAYTPHLDHLDAAAYADARSGPERVLRRVEAIDGRNPDWESPAAMLSLLCHFREVTSGTGWQALARVPDRCGPLRPYATLHATLGQTIALPAAPPGAVLVAGIEGLGVGFGEHLASLITRVAERYVLIDGHRYRVPPDTAPDGLLLDVPASADYPAPFNLSMDPRTIGAVIPGQRGGTVTIRLLTATITPWPL
jgi:hypothetical protein